jgi:hypothetical protein
MTWTRKLAVAASAVALVGAAGCAGGASQGSSGGGSAQDSSASGSNSSSAPSVTITSPKSGAKVGSSFPVTFKSSVQIGALETGEDHVHVVIDGNTNDFTVVTAHKTMVKNLSPGKHTVGITLQHADHSSAGAQDQVTVMVAKGAGTQSGTKEDNPSRTNDDNGTMNGSTSGNSSGNGYSY